jgi:hypothetical protein
LSLHKRILAAVQEAWEDGEQPNGVRLNHATLLQLQGELPPGENLRFGKTTYEKITFLETPFGSLRLIYDKHMPDDGFIVLVAIDRLRRFPIHTED